MDHLDGVLVEPVQVLNEQQRRSVPHARKEVVANRSAYPVVELAPFGGDGLIADLGIDAKHGRNSGTMVVGVERTLRDLGLSDIAGARPDRRPADATPAFQQAAHGRKPTSVWNGDPINCRTTAWDRSASSTADQARRLLPIPASP